MPDRNTVKLMKRLAFLEDKCSTYIERDIGLDRAIAAIQKEKRKRFKEWMGWQEEMRAIRIELEEQNAKTETDPDQGG